MYLLSFPQILDFIYWTALIFILIYFEWRDTENQQYSLQYLNNSQAVESESSNYITGPFKEPVCLEGLSSFDVAWENSQKVRDRATDFPSKWPCRGNQWHRREMSAVFSG